MSVEEIRQVVGQFVDAARRASQADFDGVQIHAAHFFFLSRFASPAVNHRTDAYGGSPRNRARILLEILAGVRQAAPELHVSIKFNSNDFTPGGLDEAASLELARLLAAAGIDSIEVSGNGTSVPGIRPHQNEAYFAPFAARLAEVVATPVILVGGLRSRETMESVLAETKIAALSLSRPLLREPDLPELLRTGAAARNALEQDLATTRRLGIRALPAHLLQFGDRTMFLHGLATYPEFVRAIDALTDGALRPQAISAAPEELFQLLENHPLISIPELRAAFDLRDEQAVCDLLAPLEAQGAVTLRQVGHGWFAQARNGTFSALVRSALRQPL